ncbi:unnamed protein product (macronuclear) [Paramecium tetraurelia]|uniref:Sm domain-containing protein n=2 Tax=Paramecium TaxID=5884 RepID=A0DPY0_PARTE|nr:uncharacterized protein GSPATT00002496001 [Paramecium tetraurelia]CAD8139540.1 unnamed protein product [Paramecium octaurelia]CAK85097.1 unnamed protein product [Paramecium tetraurelia]|eukprot:XP_001452494.1 hypothetical protein (macronuclear) [Paramecium tetraurelia strain d4-2]
MQSQFFQTYFRGLIERCVSVTIELKNGLQIQGQITYVDDNLNFNLVDPEVSDPVKQPQLITLKNSFIRGSTVKYVHIPQEELQEEVLISACKNEVKKQKQ